MRPVVLAKKIWRINRVAAVTTAVLLATVLVAWGINGLVMKPHARELENRLSQRQRYHREIAGGRASGRVPLQERLRRGSADIRTFWGRIPQRNAFPELLSELMNMALEAGLSIQRVQYRPDENPQEGLLRYALAFSVNADYAQVKKFVHLLERSSRLLIIDQIALSGRSNGGGVRLNVGISTYFKE